ncbi:MAG: hypothetical protein JXA94_00385 [Parachlamydiales bacterium]|nr:hypothetical protein [Parachlamydiales bacterium]
MNNKIKNLIINGKFSEANKLLSGISYEKLRNLLFIIGYENQNISSYAFIYFLLLKNETVRFHLLASELLNFAFPHIAGGYAVSLSHVRQAIELEPHNIGIQANLLFFNEIPDKLISDDEAKKIALTVLSALPENPVALDFLSNIKNE